MTTNWQKYIVGDLCDSISDTYRRHDKEVILINTSDVLEGKVLNHQPIPNEKLKGQFKKTFKKDDILFSEIRPANKRFAFVDFDNTDQYIASTKLMVLRPRQDKVLPRFLLAFLTANDTLIELQHLAETRSGTFPQITFSSEVAPLPISVPDFSTQEKIVRILTTLDDCIQNNKEINDNLEQQAVQLFQAWFISFSESDNVAQKDSEFGSIPENFVVTKVGNLPILVTDYVANGSFAALKENVALFQEPNYAYFIRNTDLKTGSFGVYVDQHSYEFLSKSTLFGGEIIISNVGDVGSVFICPVLDKPMTLGNNIIMLRPENKALQFYLYLWFKYFHGKNLIQGITGGSAQPKFNKTDFKNTSIYLPCSELLIRFHEVISPMYETIEQNLRENRHLTALKDSILPRMLNGELDVSALEL